MKSVYIVVHQHVITNLCMPKSSNRMYIYSQFFACQLVASVEVCLDVYTCEIGKLYNESECYSMGAVDHGYAHMAEAQMDISVHMACPSI